MKKILSESELRNHIYKMVLKEVTNLIGGVRNGQLSPNFKFDRVDIGATNSDGSVAYLIATMNHWNGIGGKRQFRLNVDGTGVDLTTNGRIRWTSVVGYNGIDQNSVSKLLLFVVGASAYALRNVKARLAGTAYKRYEARKGIFDQNGGMIMSFKPSTANKSQQPTPNRGQGYNVGQGYNGGKSFQQNNSSPMTTNPTNMHNNGGQMNPTSPTRR